MKGIKITAPIDGQILNYHDGKHGEEGLSILVTGVAPRNYTVLINGIEAERKKDEFTASIVIKKTEEVIEAKTINPEFSDKITVLWDKNSIKRYHFSIDDNIWFLRDIARNNYRSIFDNSYLALWEELHDKYGAKFSINIYYQCEDFNLSMLSDKYKMEWMDNSEWLHLSFHALQDAPSMPYINSTYEQIAKDYDLVTREIQRFAGEEVLDTFITIHWGETTIDACRALRDRGVKGLVGYFDLLDGKPSVSYYLPESTVMHLNNRDYWKDVKEDLIFIKNDAVIDLFEIQEIVPHLENVISNPHQEEVIELMIHEQYFYPYYKRCQPHYAEKCEIAVRWVTQKGYKPVFYSNGFIGSPGKYDKN